MPGLDAATLLALWERGSVQPMLHRAVTVLAVARPERTSSEWAAVSVGQRDAALLQVQEDISGDRLEATTHCPQCGERLEVTFTTRDLRDGAGALPKPDLRVDVLGYQVDYHLPTTEDLWAAAGHDSNGRGVLLQQCIEAARLGDAAVDPGGLPEGVLAAVVDGMARADPLADLQLELVCGTCLHRWSTTFDILRYLWSEIEECAAGVLLEVHALATAYGWSEADILSLGPRRRQCYLDLLGA